MLQLLHNFLPRLGLPDSKWLIVFWVTRDSEKLLSMDEFLEHRRQFGKNGEEDTFRDAEISEHEKREEKLLRKRLSSTVKKLSRCLHEKKPLILEIGVQIENNNKCVDLTVLDMLFFATLPNHVSCMYDQVKYFLVLIPSFVSIGLILDKLHVFG
ncbi:hypothetical protein DAI22_09g090900 [Oryza sativa Japonica Group]|nr:hypothetical protein DAI22_09g090900 [Oryza sativa Japonica Group]